MSPILRKDRRGDGKILFDRPRQRNYTPRKSSINIGLLAEIAAEYR
jgi:hypothetical protein